MPTPSTVTDHDPKPCELRHGRKGNQSRTLRFMQSYTVLLNPYMLSSQVRYKHPHPNAVHAHCSHIVAKSLQRKYKFKSWSISCDS